MKVSLGNVVLNSKKKAVPSFASKVTKVITPNGIGLSLTDRSFIDHFERENPKDSDGKRKKIEGYSHGSFNLKDIAEQGVSGRTHEVKNTSIFASNLPDRFVIKEQNPLKYNERATDDYGGLRYEYDHTVTANKIDKCNTAEPIAYVETEEGGKYLLTKFIDGIKKVGGRTTGEDANPEFVPIDKCYMRSAIETLLKFDKAGFFNPDLNCGNVQKDHYYYSGAKFIDFQWATTLPETRNKVFAFAPFEAKSNIAAFEANVIADYGIALMYKGGNAQEVRDSVKDYLQVRSEYSDKIAVEWSEEEFERIKGEVYKNPSDDVIDAELLRLSILRNHRLQFLYTDSNIETPRNMMKLIRYSALAKYSADKLVEFASSVEPKTAAEKKYFEYMKEYGEFWQEKAKSWYPATVEYLREVAAGKQSAPGRFFEAEFGDTKSEKYLLTQALTNETKEKIKMRDSDVRAFQKGTIEDLEETMISYHKKTTNSSTHDEYDSQVEELFGQKYIKPYVPNIYEHYGYDGPTESYCE